MSEFDVPVAIFNFNRPELTRRVFDVVRQIRPARMLIIADGPRASNPEDINLCAEVRSIFDEIDWSCEVSRNYSNTNMGSFRRNSTGLEWVFENVEEAIILEDDCLPELSFFPYCKELLERYRDEARVGVISGNSFVQIDINEENASSYMFSSYALTWGWATWKRVWKQVDLTMEWWSAESGASMLSTLFPRADEWQYWHRIFQEIDNGKRKNAWDYQLILSQFRHSQLCAIPEVNLVSNIGHGEGATHCKDTSSPLASIGTEELRFPLIHPEIVSRSNLLDYQIFKVRFDSYVPLALKQRVSDQFRRKLIHPIIRKVALLLPVRLKVQVKRLLKFM